MTTRKDSQPKPPSTRGLTLLKKSRAAAPRSPDEARLESFKNAYPDREYWVHLDCPEFTALCPVTGQPDFARITIRYIPGKRCVESKSLKLYLGSFRNVGTFHEEVVNRILDDLVAAIQPRQAVVKGEFHRRGGIAITVEAAHPH